MKRISMSASKRRNGNNQTIITFHAPRELVELMDKIVRCLNYPNRSEFIREAIRYYIRQLLPLITGNKILMPTNNGYIFQPMIINNGRNKNNSQNIIF